MKEITQDEFIKRSKSIHGDKFSYLKTIFSNKSGKVVIICPLHGDFEQRAFSHLSGHGCNLCGIKSASSKILQKRKDTSNLQIPKGSMAIALTQGMYTLIDCEDSVIVSGYNRCTCFKNGNFYAMTTIKEKTVYMHNLITGLKPIDHINNNSLDNRRINLRQCTQKQNSRNMRGRKNCTSKYKGVSLVKSGKWVREQLTKGS